jgi:hypothetical protein
VGRGRSQESFLAEAIKGGLRPRIRRLRGTGGGAGLGFYIFRFRGGKLRLEKIL